MLFSRLFYVFSSTQGTFIIQVNVKKRRILWKAEKKTFNVMLKYRAADSDLKALEKKNKINNCESHYSEVTNTGKRTVSLCAFPLLIYRRKAMKYQKLRRSQW